MSSERKVADAYSFMLGFCGVHDRQHATRSAYSARSPNRVTTGSQHERGYQCAVPTISPHRCLTSMTDQNNFQRLLSLCPTILRILRIRGPAHHLIVATTSLSRAVSTRFYGVLIELTCFNGFKLDDGRLSDFVFKHVTDFAARLKTHWPHTKPLTVEFQHYSDDPEELDSRQERLITEFFSDLPEQGVVRLRFVKHQRQHGM
ncbi:hypothetical protein OBBRIDRAFT_155650 [Obba rivulosa]|uniref:Uncharacterized protein n=1 Tax=Obba rivulosa TaxID=1052685 RepID=A0A8E2ASZ1_9APHY|nr:hypothetical protein OBBRIDRAFT_155650 [Obba rivulosa]